MPDTILKISEDDVVINQVFHRKEYEIPVDGTRDIELTIIPGQPKFILHVIGTPSGDKASFNVSALIWAEGASLTLKLPADTEKYLLQIMHGRGKSHFILMSLADRMALLSTAPRAVVEIPSRQESIIRLFAETGEKFPD